MRTMRLIGTFLVFTTCAGLIGSAAAPACDKGGGFSGGMAFNKAGGGGGFNKAAFAGGFNKAGFGGGFNKAGFGGKVGGGNFDKPGLGKEFARQNAGGMNKAFGGAFNKSLTGPKPEMPTMSGAWQNPAAMPANINAAWLNPGPIGFQK